MGAEDFTSAHTIKGCAKGLFELWSGLLLNLHLVLLAIVKLVVHAEHSAAVGGSSVSGNTRLRWRASIVIVQFYMLRLGHLESYRCLDARLGTLTAGSEPCCTSAI